MASLGVRCGGNQSFIHKPRFRFPIVQSKSNLNLHTNQIAQPHHSSSISNYISRKTPEKISAWTALSNPPTFLSCSDNLGNEFQESLNRETLFPEKLDEWMRSSVEEIVKNLKQAPLLVQVYAKNNGTTKLKTEKAFAENWPVVMREWRETETTSPDGIILVEELDDELELEGLEEDETRAWGILIQGKGVECAPVCYLLKTTRVAVGAGLGLFCNHFCLMRVKSFSESAVSQLTDFWLLQ